MKEFWIRKGTNEFSYEYFDDSSEGISRSLSGGNQFYDAVVLSPIEGGIHVIEKSAYDELKDANKRLQIWKDESMHVFNPIMDFEHNEMQLGESRVSFLLKIAKERDDLKDKIEQLECKYKERSIAMQDTGMIMRELFVPKIRKLLGYLIKIDDLNCEPVINCIIAEALEEFKDYE